MSGVRHMRMLEYNQSPAADMPDRDLVEGCLAGDDRAWAALVERYGRLIDAVIRLVPGVLGDERSNAEDSFTGEKRLLEFAQYTRPREYRGLAVPEVLLSGDHQAIARWRQGERVARTSRRMDCGERTRHVANRTLGARIENVQHLDLAALGLLAEGTQIRLARPNIFDQRPHPARQGSIGHWSDISYRRVAQE